MAKTTVPAKSKTTVKPPARPAPAAPQRPAAAAPPQPARQSPRPPQDDRATRSTAVATRAPATAATHAPAPAWLEDHMDEDAGKGLSKDSADNLVPLIYLLQPTSPQAEPRNPAYIEGAQPGMIWLKNHADGIIDGENEGMLVQLCHFSKGVLEWISRDDGGGFVARHEKMPENAERVQDPDDPRIVRYATPDGHELIETREHVVRVFLPNGEKWAAVIPMAGTQHSVSRGWMTMMNGKLVSGKSAPIFAGLYRLRSTYKTNKKGSWFLWTVSDEGWVSPEDYVEGKNLFAAFSQGDKTANYVEEAGIDDAGDPEAGEAGDEENIPL